MSTLSLNDQLVIAAKNGDAVAVTNALQAGANVHYNNDDALQWAARNGHQDIIQILLDAGANASAASDNAMRWAARNGHENIVQTLRKQMTFADRVNEAIAENNTTYKNSDKFKVLVVDQMTADGKNAKPGVISRKPRDLLYVPGLPIAVNKRKPGYKEKYFQAIDLLSAQTGQNYSQYKTKFSQMTAN